MAGPLRLQRGPRGCHCPGEGASGADSAGAARARGARGGEWAERAFEGSGRSQCSDRTGSISLYNMLQKCTTCFLGPNNDTTSIGLSEVRRCIQRSCQNRSKTRHVPNVPCVWASPRSEAHTRLRIGCYDALGIQLKSWKTVSAVAYDQGPHRCALLGIVRV